MQSFKFAIVAVAAIMAPLAEAGAQTVEGTQLNIVAQGMSEAAPDMAFVMLGVATRDDSAQGALGENSRLMTALVQSLRRAGVAERFIQTARVNVNPRYDWNSGASRLVGYDASNSVRVEVRDLDNLGRIIDAAIAAGGNTVNSVSFQRQDAQAQLDAARRDAVTEARRRADLYAQALGMRVARVVAVTESGARAPTQEIVVTASRRNGAQEAPVTPILPGEIETQVSMSVTFELR